MFTLSSLVQKAQAYIDPSLPSTTGPNGKVSKASLFRYQFRLPDSQSPSHEIAAELSLSRSSGVDLNKDRSRASHHVGRLYLSEDFLCFSTQGTSFLGSASSTGSLSTGQTHGAGPAGNGFTLPLCAIRRVERLPTQSYIFALAISPWNGTKPPASPGQGANKDGPKLTLQLGGSRAACERFCDALKKRLRDGVKGIEKLREVVSHCYSEYLMSGAHHKEKAGSRATNTPAPPDVGLGMVFRYPGDARKLRDGGKMRLWSEYFRGQLVS